MPPYMPVFRVWPCHNCVPIPWQSLSPLHSLKPLARPRIWVFIATYWPVRKLLRNPQAGTLVNLGKGWDLRGRRWGS